MPLRKSSVSQRTVEPPSAVRIPRSILDAYTAFKLARTPADHPVMGIWGTIVTLADLEDLVDECNPSKAQKDASRARMQRHLAPTEPDN